MGITRDKPNNLTTSAWEAVSKGASGNFGRNGKSKVRFAFFRTEYSESPEEVVQFQLEYFDRNNTATVNTRF